MVGRGRFMIAGSERKEREARRWKKSQ